MELAQDKLDLIEKVIKNNSKYSANEDLYDDFFNETCKRSLGIVKVVTSDAALESYLRKIATTSILNVLKDSGRLRRTKSGFVKTDEVLVEDTTDYSKFKISYDEFKIEESPETIVAKNDVLQSIFNTVVKIDDEEPKKRYLQIYKLRYDNEMTQKEISDELGLSQSEVSKRLFDLMEKVKLALR